MTDLLAAIICFCLWLRLRQPDARYVSYGRRVAANEEPRYYRTRRKPDWVPQEIVRLKAMQPNLSCRDIANLFNRMYAARRNMTVGKTYVAGIIKRHAYTIADVRNRVRRRQGKPGRKNGTLGD